jgi:hypothetical protein
MAECNNAPGFSIQGPLIGLYNMFPAPEHYPSYAKEEEQVDPSKKGTEEQHKL